MLTLGSFVRVETCGVKIPYQDVVQGQPEHAPAPGSPGRSLDALSLILGLKGVRDSRSTSVVGVAELPKLDVFTPSPVWLGVSEVPILLPPLSEASREGTLLSDEWKWLSGLGPRFGRVEIKGGTSLQDCSIRLAAGGQEGDRQPSMPFELVRRSLPTPAWTLSIEGESLMVRNGDLEGRLPLREGGWLEVRPLQTVTSLRDWDRSGDPNSNGKPSFNRAWAGPTILIFGHAPDQARPRSVELMEAVASAVEQILQVPLLTPADRARASNPGSWFRERLLILLMLVPLGWGAGQLLGLALGTLSFLGLIACCSLFGSCGPLARLPWILAGLGGLLASAPGTRLVQEAMGRLVKKARPGYPASGHSDLPPDIQQRYTHISVLGSGTMGKVYAAMDLITNQRVIIKTVIEDRRASQEIRKRFLREMEVLVRVEHPNVIRVLEVRRDGFPYFVMENFEGQDLRSLLQRAGRLSVDQVLKIGHGAASGLARAHSMGIIHRDIKPENILIGSGGTVKLIDFGLAYLKDVTSITEEGVLVGTPLYMAPERLEGSLDTEHSDLFSLGVVLYECLTGRVPHEGSIPLRLADAPIRSPHDLFPAISTQTSDLVMRCLQRQEKRWQRTGDLVDALCVLVERTGEESS